MAGNKKTKILIAASEFEPYTNIGHLGRVVSNLSAALVDRYVVNNSPHGGYSFDVRVVIPAYTCIPARFTDGAMPVAEFDSTLGRRTNHCIVYRTIYNGVPVYLMSCGGYFDREQVYSSVTDDVERYSFFCNAILDMGQRIDFEPDIIQCHDWQLSFIPTLHRAGRRRGLMGDGCKTLLVIHSMQYQGVCSRYEMLDLLDLSADLFTPATMEFYGQANSLKGGLLFADHLVTVSSNYAAEVQHAYYGENLEGIIRARAASLRGVMCGIDQSIYDPARDHDIFAGYDVSSVAVKKPENKRRLQELLGFEQNPDIPLVIVMSDVLDNDKGMDLVKFVFDDIMTLGVQVIFASKGKSEYDGYCSTRAAEYPGSVAYTLYRGAYMDILDHERWLMAAEDAAYANEASDDNPAVIIGASGEVAAAGNGAAGAASAAGADTANGADATAGGADGANATVVGVANADCGGNACDASLLTETMLICGSDILLRPSRVEPCGEKHLIALKYGTIPIVRETGGLKDVIVPYNEETGEGNGFSFFNYNAHDMLFTLNRALVVYREKRDAWAALIRSAMGVDVEWKGTADGYAELYMDILNK